MSTKRKIEDDIMGYKPFKTTLPKPKKTKPKKKKHWKIGDTYDPTPKDFGKQFDPMNNDPPVTESFARFFLLSLKRER